MAYISDAHNTSAPPTVSVGGGIAVAGTPLTAGIGGCVVGFVGGLGIIFTAQQEFYIPVSLAHDWPMAFGMGGVVGLFMSIGGLIATNRLAAWVSGNFYQFEIAPVRELQSWEQNTVMVSKPDTSAGTFHQVGGSGWGVTKAEAKRCAEIVVLMGCKDVSVSGAESRGVNRTTFQKFQANLVDNKLALHVNARRYILTEAGEIIIPKIAKGEL